MANVSNIDPNFWKTVKIKELPIKTELTDDSVLLIQDDQDTKQMNVNLFFQAINDAANDLFNMMREKIIEINGILEDIKAKDEQYAINEAERQGNENKRIEDEQERRAQFDEWIRIWDTIWTPFYNKTVERENERISNEEYRVEEFARWLAMITQWEKDEQSRSEAEKIREQNESTRQQQEQQRQNQFNTKITEVNNKIIEVNNKITEMNQTITSCKNATTECINVTNQLRAMFEIGADVPTSLPNNKLYFQYF